MCSGLLISSVKGDCFSCCLGFGRVDFEEKSVALDNQGIFRNVRHLSFGDALDCATDSTDDRLFTRIIAIAA